MRYSKRPATAISVLNRNGINYKLFESTKKLLFEIEKCLDDDYDEEIELERSLYEEDETIIEDEDYEEYSELLDELEKSNEALYVLM